MEERNWQWIDPEGKNSVDCYICEEEISAKATNWGFTWGSDGAFPDGASAMYCCWECRASWIDPTQEITIDNKPVFVSGVAPYY